MNGLSMKNGKRKKKLINGKRFQRSCRLLYFSDISSRRKTKEKNYRSNMFGKAHFPHFDWNALTQPINEEKLHLKKSPSRYFALVLFNWNYFTPILLI